MRFRAPISKLLCLKYEAVLQAAFVSSLSFSEGFGYIRLFFLHLLNAVCNDEESEYATENDVITAEILQRISADPANVTLKEIAQKQGYNYNYLSNLIKENTGRSFSELKKSAQYGNVCELLIKTDYPVEEIARMCGFGNLSYFYKNFVLRYGVSPNHFRKKNL